MSLHFLLDGYNIINQVPSLANAKLEDGRRGLIMWLTTSSPQGSAANSVTVVFDGHPDYFGGSGEQGSVRVVFSDGESADDCIKRIVESAKNKKKYVVVSNDKGITLYVRALGAGVIGVREFAADFFKPKNAGKKKTAPTSSGASSKYVSLTAAQKINKELEKLWLK